MHGHLSEFHVSRGNASAQTGDPGRRPQEYERDGVIGGFARLATAVRGIRAKRGAGNVLLVDAGVTFGDQLLSNHGRGDPAMLMMDALGYKFMALCNHDFEYTAANTRRLQGLVRFPMRAANALLRDTVVAGGSRMPNAGDPFLGNPMAMLIIADVNASTARLRGSSPAPLHVRRSRGKSALAPSGLRMCTQARVVTGMRYVDMNFLEHHVCGVLITAERASSWRKHRARSVGQTGGWRRASIGPEGGPGTACSRRALVNILHSAR